MKEQQVTILLSSDLEGHELQEAITDALDDMEIKWDFITSKGVDDE